MIWPPDYTAEFARRQKRLLQIRNNPTMIAGALEYYRTRPVEFISDWCVTYDPRLAGGDRPAKMPFIPFDRQKDLIRFLYQCVYVQNNGLIEKARDMGATWIACAVSVHLWRFMPGASVGWGSRKEQLVDKLGDADSIFEKMRIIIREMPQVFWPVGFNPDDHMPFMRIINPDGGATITGEAGDNIGRGGRKLIYFKDEAAHYERPEKIEAALADNTRVQIDISSVNGLGNVFHRRRKAGQEWHPLIPMSRDKTAVFVMDWRHHPEKTQEWYEERRRKAVDDGLSHVFAQEVDRNYAASVTGTIIKSEWVNAAIGLDIPDDGPVYGSLDVADEGGDKNALGFRKGPCLKFAEAWGDGDTGKTARRAAIAARAFGPLSLMYDSVGVGAGVKAETNRLASEGLMPAGLRFVPWSAGAKTQFPDKRMIPLDKQSMLNKDYFQNLKSQAWWQLARRLERTWQHVTGVRTYDPAELISIPANLLCLDQIQEELTQVTWSMSSATMKMVINKSPDGTNSPNLADMLVMLYWPIMTGVDLYSGKNVHGV